MNMIFSVIVHVTRISAPLRSAGSVNSSLRSAAVTCATVSETVQDRDILTTDHYWNDVWPIE